MRIFTRVYYSSDKYNVRTTWVFDQISMSGSRIASYSSLLIPTLLIILCSFYSTIYAQLDTPFILPFKAEPVFATSRDDSENDSDDEPIDNVNAVTSCNNTDLTDGFDSEYYLDEGKISPNGQWKNEYLGYGSTGVESADPRNNAFYLKPKAVTSVSQTEAALVRSSGSFCNFIVEFDMNTVNQLREGSPPKTWEAGWFLFRYTDMFHYYWLVIRSDGFELGKKDCNTCGDPADGQEYLVTKSLPTLNTNTWQHWKVEGIDNHFKVWIDNKLIVDFEDEEMTSQLTGGNIAMYSEDAYVKYDNMILKSIA